MGKKKWLGAVKRVFSPNSKSQKSHKLKEKLPDASQSESFENSTDHPLAIVPHQEDFVLVDAEHGKREESHPDPVIAATAAADQNAGKAELSTGLLRVDDKSREEAAAIKIQTAFRGHLARRALRALRGLVRLKTLIHGNSVKRQATTTLRCMQTLARVQSQIRSRRIRMSEENQALQRQLLLKREKELENLKMGDEWDDSLQSKQQIEAGLLSKQEAATKRERALAYAFSHQWKNSSRSANPLFMDPNNPHWGWSWLERWMAARPWETRGTSDREPNGSDRSSVKAPTITDAYANRDKNPDKLSPSTLKPAPLPARQSPSTPTTKVSALTKKVVKSASPRSGWAPPADDTRSVLSVQSERPRRHSLAGSSVRDDESFTSSPAVPSYMVPTESARARSRFQSGITDNIDTASEKGSVSSVKKRLSFPVGEKNLVASSSLVRRHSGPPKVDASSAKDGLVTENGSSGGSK